MIARYRHSLTLLTTLWLLVFGCMGVCVVLLSAACPLGASSPQPYQTTSTRLEHSQSQKEPAGAITRLNKNSATRTISKAGTPENPVVLQNFPQEHIGEFGSEIQKEPSCGEGAREQFFRLILEHASILRLALHTESEAQVHLLLSLETDEAELIAEEVNELLRPLPAGTYRLVLRGPQTRDAIPYMLEAALELPRARQLGSVWNTFYIRADEDDYIGPTAPHLYDSRCRSIARVRRAFYNSLCIQGSGILSDRRIVNYARSCTNRCPRAEICRNTTVAICYQVLDSERYPWGMGKDPRPLVPDWSIAVDPSFVPLDSVLYLEELDGVVPPGKTEPHDGCVAAVDTGGGINDDHIDIFAGTRERWLEWEKLLPTRTRFKTWIDHPRCFSYRLRADGDVSKPWWLEKLSQ